MVQEETINALFEQHAHKFWEQKFNELSKTLYRHPLPVYAHGRISVRRTASETAAALFAQRQIAVQRGMHGIRAGEIAWNCVDIRLPVAVTWLFLGADGRPSGDLQIRYYMRQDTDGLRIEIAEHLGGTHDIPPAATMKTRQH